jgi:hypothetical protein
MSYESFSHRHHSYRRRGQYAEQLERVFEHFPRSQVHVVESETYFARPAQEYDNLLGFLGLQPFHPAEFVQLNARPGAPMPAHTRQTLEEHFTSHNARLTNLLGRSPRWTQIAEAGDHRNGRD